MDHLTPPIIIYQMGKVGSTAIHKSLKHCFSNVFQVHSLVRAKLEKSSRILNEKGLGIPKHIRTSNSIIQDILDTELPVKIITPIRNPLNRNISAFFQDLGTQIILQDKLREGLQISPLVKKIRLLPFPNEWKNLIIQRIISSKLTTNISFLIDYFKSNYRHRIPLDWFDNELNEALGINVFNAKFDKIKGYQIYSHEHIELLVIKSELSNEIKSKVISQFVEKEIPPIAIDHQSKNKSYGVAQNLFKTQITLDKEFLTPYLESKYYISFYSDKDKDK